MEITLVTEFPSQTLGKKRESEGRGRKIWITFERYHISSRGWFLVTNFCLRKNKSESNDYPETTVCLFFFKLTPQRNTQYLDIKLEREDWGFCSSFLSNDKENKGWKPTVTQSLRTRVGSCIFFFFFKFPGPCLACAWRQTVLLNSSSFLKNCTPWSCYQSQCLSFICQLQIIVMSISMDCCKK